MKIAFIGDTHKNKHAINLALKKINELSAHMIIHLGDCIDDINLIKDNFQGQVIGVAGNCDYGPNIKKDGFININNKKIFFTHGDLYNVKSSLTSLLYKGEELGADIILFGHTHMQMIEEVNKILIMNPGSIPKPSPWSMVGSVGLIDIADDGKIISKELYKVPMK